MTNNDRLVAGVVFVALCCVYFVTMMAFGHFGTSPVSYFNLLADAFLHGHADLPAPPSTVDLAWYGGRWYVPFPPLPALLMIPGVFAFGVSRFNVGAFVGIAGSVAGAGAFLVLSQMSAQRMTKLTRRENVILAAAFAIGTVSWYMSTSSNVWFVAQVTTYACAIVALYIVISGGSPFAAGIALGLASTGRPHSIALIPLLVALRYVRVRTLSVRWLLKLISPVIAAAIGLALYNYDRFGVATEFGYRYSLANHPGSDFQKYGQLSFHFLPRNLYAMFLELPRWSPARHLWTPNPEGMSLLITMPFMVWAARARVDWMPLVWAAWLSLVLGLTAPLLYYTTGWFQFGPRFFLDVMPAALVLVALGVREGLTPAFYLVIGASILVNAGGVVWWHWAR